MARLKGVKGIWSRKTLVDVDLSGSKIKLDERVLKKKGFGAKTVSLNLSNTGIGVADLTALRDYIDLLNNGKGISLKTLDLNNNGFSKSTHGEISKLIKEISKRMATGKVINFKEGNNGFNTPYAFLPDRDHDNLLGSLRIGGNIYPPLDAECAMLPYKSAFTTGKRKKEKKHLFSCFSFMT